MAQQYVILFMNDSSGSSLPQEEKRRMHESWMKAAEAGARLGVGAPVAGPATAKAVVVRDGTTIATDGPFPEFKEWFAGFGILEADSIDAAAGFMAAHPSAVLGRILILPVVRLPWEQDDDPIDDRREPATAAQGESA